MADESNPKRFIWQSGEVEMQDDDGNWVQVGETPEYVKEILKRHDEKVKRMQSGLPEEPEENAAVPAQDSACGCTTEVKRKTADKRPRKLPRVQVHIHRGR